jgi:hypothetical protein
MDRRQFLRSGSLAAGAGFVGAVPGVAAAAAPLPAAIQSGKGVSVDPLPRTQHSSCLLQGNLILVVGGFGIGGGLVSCQIFDPNDGRWYDAAPLGRPRRFHSATPVSGGNVLVLGGFDGSGGMDLASVYDPVRDKWESVRPLTVPRYQHAAQPLHDGRVVLTGGYHYGPIAGAEVYDY